MYFKELKNTTKKAQTIIQDRENTLKRYGCRNLNDCYIKCSNKKYQAENDIIHLLYEMNGKKYTIHGFNCDTFSCSFENEKYIFYFTKCHSYKIAK